MTGEPLDLDAVEKRYSVALDSKPSKGPMTNIDGLVEAVCDIPGLVDELKLQRKRVAALLALPSRGGPDGRDMFIYTTEDIRRTIAAADKPARPASKLAEHHTPNCALLIRHGDCDCPRREL